MTEPILKITDLQCGYDGVQVIHGVSMEVAEGELVAIIGANGAGKSTIMKSIAGLMNPTAGSIVFAGEDITNFPAHKNVPKGISYVPEGRRLFSRLSVKENLELGAFGVQDRALVEERLEMVFGMFPILKARATQQADTMSGGEQQMCAIGRGLMNNPKLLMLDELSLGLMPSLVEKVLEAVVAINRKGVTVLLVEQMVQEALEIANRGYVVQTGKIVQEGSGLELLDSEDVRKAYLGL